MKRIFPYCTIIIWTLVLIASCGHNRQVVHGFVDEPQDSLFLDLKEYVYPAIFVHAKVFYIELFGDTNIVKINEISNISQRFQP